MYICMYFLRELEGLSPVQRFIEIEVHNLQDPKFTKTERKPFPSALIGVNI